MPHFWYDPHPGVSLPFSMVKLFYPKREGPLPTPDPQSSLLYLASVEYIKDHMYCPALLGDLCSVQDYDVSSYEWME